MDRNVTSDTILDQYRKLNRTPSGEHHAKEYDILHRLVLSNQDQLYELIFSGKISSERELDELICFGGHGGSVSKKDNLYWIPFMKRINQRVTELPAGIQSSFEWLGKVHHYWD